MYQAGREAVMNGPTALQPVYPQPIPLEPRAQSAVGRLCALCLQPARPSSVLTHGVRSRVFAQSRGAALCIGHSVTHADRTTFLFLGTGP